MHRGLIGCVSDLELNGESVNLTRYINSTQVNIAPKSGPCTTMSSSKRECSCEHGGECRNHNGGSWSCDCSKTGFTGRRCEHPTYHLDLSRISTLELNTQMQWSEQINDIAFGLKVNERRLKFERTNDRIVSRRDETTRIFCNFVRAVQLKTRAIRSSSRSAMGFCRSISPLPIKRTRSVATIRFY